MDSVLTITEDTNRDIDAVILPYGIISFQTLQNKDKRFGTITLWQYNSLTEQSELNNCNNLQWVVIKLPTTDRY